jgi:hypothetical protein
MGLRSTASRSRATDADERRRRLRHPAAALAAVALLVLSACAAGAAQPNSAAEPSGGASVQAEEPPPGIVPPGEWTEAQTTWLVNKVREAEEKLPQFNDQSQLAGLGFVNIGVLAGGYSHYVNVGWMSDAHFLNPDYPESLVYDMSGNVVAVMFFMSPTMTVEQLPSMISWLPGWHAHPELCSDDQGRVVGFPIGGQCTRGRVVTNPMMHVWIVDNACGHRFGGLGGGGLLCEHEH